MSNSCIKSIMPFSYECMSPTTNCYLTNQAAGQLFKFGNILGPYITYGTGSVQLIKSNDATTGWDQDGSTKMFEYGTSFKGFTILSNEGKSGKVNYGDQIYFTVGTGWIETVNPVNNCQGGGFGAGILNQCPDQANFYIVSPDLSDKGKAVNINKPFYLYSTNTNPYQWVGTSGLTFIDAASSLADISCRNASTPVCSNGKVNCGTEAGGGAHYALFIIIAIILIGIFII